MACRKLILATLESASGVGSALVSSSRPIAASEISAAQRSANSGLPRRSRFGGEHKIYKKSTVR